MEELSPGGGEINKRRTFAKTCKEIALALPYVQPVHAEAKSARNFDASGDRNALLNCFVCERSIPDGNWFARFRVGNRRIAFCRPRCVEIFLDDRETYSRRIEDSFAASGGAPF